MSPLGNRLLRSLMLRLLGFALPCLCASVLAAQSGAPIPVGINLRPITPYDRQLAFADAMKMASEWRYEDDGSLPPVRQVGKNGTKPPTAPDIVPLDRNGWPRPSRGRTVACHLFIGMRGKIPVGEYVITWKGKGTLEFRGHVGIVSAEPNRLVVQVNGVSGGQPGLALSDVDLGDPIRDIHVWLPGLDEACSYFQPAFLERLRPFSVLRFYPWMRVYTTVGRWSERSTIDWARQGTTEGVAIEYMVELANELAADPWFCIPHTADDDYVRRFATYVRDTLNPAAKIYVEFSNETWNTDFAAGRWAREQSQLLGVPAMHVVAERAGQVFDLWREVFGTKAARVVRVVGVQLHNPGIASVLTRELEGNYDALALGTYFGARADQDDVDVDSTAEELLAAAVLNLNQEVLPRIEDHRNQVATLSSQLGRPIRLITYEGGPSIVARSPGGGLGFDASLACHNLPQMYDVYRALIDGARARGVDLFVGYDFCGARTTSDTYSVLESLTDPLDAAPKYRALVLGWESRGQ